MMSYTSLNVGGGHKAMSREKKKFVVATTVGSIVALIGIIMATSANFVFDLILRTEMVLKPNSANFPFWSDLPMPIQTSMFIFNMTNADNFSAGLDLPNLEEVGPYVFNEYHKKVDLVWNNNGTVTYKQIRTFQFVPELSKGSLDDQLVILNVPAATVGATAQKLPKITRGVMNLALKAFNEKLFVKKSAREILFDGYKDPVLDAAEFIHKFNVPIPGIMDKFGFYYGRNGSDWWDGVFNMFTGSNNLHRLGEVAAWNYSTRTDFFPGKCGDIRGVGDFFPPYMPDTAVELFSNDLCRPIELTYDGWDSIKGVPGKKYRVDSSYFGSSIENPDNICYELGPSPLPSGVYNASSCRFGAPIFMSQPHFYQADPFYSSKIFPGAMKPDVTKHETVFVVESQSGIPVKVAARFQVNALVEQIDEIDLFKDVPAQTFFPVVWFESKFELAESLACQMWLLSHLHLIMVVTGLLMGTVGLAVAVSFGVCYSIKKNGLQKLESTEQYRPIVGDEEPVAQVEAGAHESGLGEVQAQVEEQPKQEE